MKTAPLVIILIIGLGILGYIFVNKQNETDINTNNDFSFSEEEDNTPMTPNNNTGAQTTPVTPPPTNPTPTNPPVTINTSTFANNRIGASFNYPSILGEDNFVIDSGIFSGHLGCTSNGCKARFGGITENFIGEISENPQLRVDYPATEELQSLAQRGYRNEIKTNLKGQQYVLVYGQKEVDMPYLGEGQMLAIFRLKSSPEFKVIGFQFSDFNIFSEIIDTVDIY